MKTMTTAFGRHHPAGCPCGFCDGADAGHARDSIAVLRGGLRMVADNLDGVRPVSEVELRHLPGSPDELAIAAEVAHAD
jgi:hypothetical protein